MTAFQLTPTPLLPLLSVIDKFFAFLYPNLCSRVYLLIQKRL